MNIKVVTSIPEKIDWRNVSKFIDKGYYYRKPILKPLKVNHEL